MLTDEVFFSQGIPLAVASADMDCWCNLTAASMSTLYQAITSSSSIASSALNNLGASLDTAFGEHSFSRINQWLEQTQKNSNLGLLERLGVNICIVDDLTGVSSGAYSKSTNSIFLSSSFIQQASPESLTGVLVEEIGHAIDAKINSIDAPGDEGEIFAHLAFGRSISNEYSTLLNEDDSGILSFNGSKLEVERNTSVTVYEHANYSGKAKQFNIGEYSYVGNDFNDIITSIQVPTNSNIVVEAFQNADFQGRSTILSYSQASIGADWSDPNWRVSHMNDAVSSLKVRYQRQDEIIFYQHGKFQGLGHSGPLGSNATVKFNDDYSSIDLPSGAEISIYEHTSFGGLRAAYLGDAASLGSLNDKVSSYKAYRPYTENVSLSRIQGSNLVENKETWFVIHGWNNSEADFFNLASAIEDYDGRGYGDQVFTVDWKGARTGVTSNSLYIASTWIDTVAETIKRRVESWGLQSSKINIVGHSLGAYVAYELSERLGAVNRIVSLHAASLTQGGYDQVQVDFRKVSNWSWAFWHNPVSDNEKITLTADESFKLVPPIGVEPYTGHGSGKTFWTNVLRNPTSAIGSLFGLDKIRSRTRPWRIDSGWEAAIALDLRMAPTGKYWEI